MNHYRIILIGEAGNAGRDQLNKIKAAISEQKGKVGEVTPLGKKTFSYPIAKKKEGEYWDIRCMLPPDAIAPLKKEIRQKEIGIRLLIIHA